MKMILLVIGLVIIYVCFNLFVTLRRNQAAHRFFKEKAPNLPALPSPSIWNGHLFEVPYTDKNWKIITNLHNKYGKSFGYYMCEQPWISTKDPRLLKLVFADQGHLHYNKSIFNVPLNYLNSSLFQKNDDDWRRARRAIAPVLTKHKIQSDEVSGDILLIVKRLKDCLDFKLSQANDQTGSRSIILDVHETFQRFSLAVIFLITYKQDDLIDFYADEDTWSSTIETGLKGIADPLRRPLISLNIMFPFLRPLISQLIRFDGLDKLQVKVKKFITQTTELNRLAREAKQKQLHQDGNHIERQKISSDFKRRLVDSVIESFIERQVKHEDLVGNLLFFLLAGFETIADTLTCLFWQLSQYPEVQQKLRSALRDGGLDEPYVLWCILETVRWHPPVPLNGGRWLAKDVEHEGQIYPKGSYIVPSVYSIHHDTEMWEDADTFKPERWQDQNSFSPGTFMGFGLGQRNCVGYQLAIYEIKVVMQMMLANYQVEKFEGTADKYEFSSPGLAYTILDQPIKVRLVPV